MEDEEGTLGGAEMRALKTNTAVVLACLCLCVPAAAKSIKDAKAAYGKEDYATALRIVRPLAENGDAQAQGLLGLMYLLGRGVPADSGEAVKWIRAAADQGDPAAQRTLGYIYESGQGVSQDFAEAIRLYQKAADQGFAEGQLALGHMYAQGKGIAQDYVRAHMWFNLAAADGLLEAEIDRDKIARRMTPEQIAEAKKLAREWKPKKGQQ